jgi:fatty acid desaturase
MWHIYGSNYDLTQFVDKHPGGSRILNMLRGESDITPLFESYHSFSNKQSIKRQLESYKVTEAVVGSSKQYNYYNYDELLHLVKQRFPDRRSIKANNTYFLYTSLLLLVFCISFYISVFSKCPFAIKVITVLIAGFIYGSMGFVIMHDASHYAISTYPEVNILCSRIWNSFALWNATIWFYHHVLQHHAFTSEIGKDPDLYHYRPFFRKTTATKVSPTFSKHQGNVWMIMSILLLFPGQFTGQTMSYLSCFVKNRMYKSKMKIQVYGQLEVFVMMCSLCCLYKAGIVLSCIYHLALNIMYHVAVVGDHDTFESAVTNRYSGNDWLRLQIQNSGNWVNNYPVWTFFCGALNFQIEHHLFPGMSSIHYPTIKPIVVEYCKKHKIPYVHHETFFDMYNSFLKTMGYFSLTDLSPQ